jgi:type IV secretion system protein VirD4
MPPQFYGGRHNHDPGASLAIGALILFLIWLYVRNRRQALDAFGTASLCTEKVLQGLGMLGARGLILGRTASGALIRIRKYCHVLLCGGTGSGKGVSIIIPNLIDYSRGGMVVNDPKGDLHKEALKLRKLKGRIIRVAPFSGGEDCFNPLDTIPDDSPLFIDSARAMAEALVVRQGTETDPYWNEKAVQVITAILVFVLTRVTGSERNLNSVQDIASDPLLILAVSDKLKELGGIPARLGNQLRILFDKEGNTTKETCSVLNTVARHLGFLDSQVVANTVSTSTFDVLELLEPGNVLFLQIPGDQLEAQRGFLRCITSTLIRVIGSSGHEESSEVLFLLDEASALGSLSAIEEALVRGRSAGVRLLLAYQSAAQIETAFKDKPTLLYDNCSSQIWLCPPGSYETAERISKSMGSYTQWVVGYGTSTNGSVSSQQGGSGSTSGWGSSTDYKQQGRALLLPEEVLCMDDELLIAFIRGLPGPVLAQRVKYYEDSDFNPAAPRRRRTGRRGLLGEFLIALFKSLLLALCFLLIAYLVDRSNHNQPILWR